MDLSRPVLVYSNFCRHSKKFLEITLKNPELYEKLIRMNIDIDPETRKRPDMFYRLQEFIQMKIERVPTIITKVNKDLLVLSDAEAFKWLDYHMKSRTAECIGFNPLEMVEFSDKYANYNSTRITDLNDAKEQSYKFLKDKKLTPDNIFSVPGYGNQGVPQEDGMGDTKQNMSYKQTEREQMDAKYQQRSSGAGNLGGLRSTQDNRMHKVNMSEYNSKVNMYNVSPQATAKNANIDFTNPNFGLAGKFGNTMGDSKGSEKAKILDQRLQQLLNERGN